MKVWLWESRQLSASRLIHPTPCTNAQQEILTHCEIVSFPRQLDEEVFSLCLQTLWRCGSHQVSIIRFKYLIITRFNSVHSFCSIYIQCRRSVLINCINIDLYVQGTVWNLDCCMKTSWNCILFINVDNASSLTLGKTITYPSTAHCSIGPNHVYVHQNCNHLSYTMENYNTCLIHVPVQNIFIT